MNSSELRRAAIRDILANEDVASQSELLELLASRGFQTTQPVLSRDLRTLKVAKRDGAYQLLEQEKITPLEVLSSLLRGVHLAGEHLVVVRCEPGAASAIARALESERVKGVVGTVAGDDTVFAAVLSAEVGDLIAGRVRNLL